VVLWRVIQANTARRAARCSAVPADCAGECLALEGGGDRLAEGLSELELTAPIERIT
jgi:hypothetical protein